jgi:hypothetical protein
LIERRKLLKEYIDTLDQASNYYLKNAIGQGATGDDIAFCIKNAAHYFGLMNDLASPALETFDKTLEDIKQRKWAEDMK